MDDFTYHRESDDDAEPFTRSEPAATTAAFCGDNHGNVAGQQTVKQMNFQTYIKVDGGFSPIEKAPLQRLHKVRMNLLRLISKHEMFALTPVVLTACVVGMIWVGVDLLALWFLGEAVPKQGRWLVLFISALFGLPIWFALYDVRRRHRRVVERAELRWAAIVVEIGERGAGNPDETPWQAFKRWRREMKRRRQR